MKGCGTMLEEIKVREYLQGKERISIPELQKAFACGYGEAKAMVNRLIETYWIENKVEDVYYPLHVQRLNPKTLPAEECQNLWDTLSDKELALLGQLLRQEQEPDTANYSRFHGKLYEEELQSLIKQGLVHSFAEKYFLSVTEETVNQIKEAGEERPEDPMLAEVAYPILISCLARQEDELEITENLFLPKTCKQYIYDGLARFRVHQKKPKKLQSADDFNRNTLRYEAIEAFLSNCKFQTKEEYEEEAERQCAMLRSSRHCPGAYKRAVEEACREIIEELTLSNIKEIQRILADTRED